MDNDLRDSEDRLRKALCAFDLHAIKDLPGRSHWLGGRVEKIFSRRPDFVSLFEFARDPFAESLFREMTSGQRDAVCTFLGELMASNDAITSFAAAQSLKWNWGHYPHAATKAASRLYNRLHTFRHPNVENNQISGLLSEIDAAFDLPNVPIARLIVERPVDSDAAENALELGQLPWNQIHPFLLARESSSLFLLSDLGFRSILPAFMKLELYEYAYVVVDEELPVVWGSDVSYALTFAFDESQDGMELALFRSKMDLFSRRQRRAITYYLEFVLSRLNEAELDGSLLNRALNQYWRVIEV